MREVASEKSIERKIRKLFLYGKTHKGPRKRKSKNKKVDNLPILATNLQGNENVFSSEEHFPELPAVDVSLNNAQIPFAHPGIDKDKLTTASSISEVYVNASSGNERVRDSATAFGTSYKTETERLVQNLVGLIPESTDLTKIKDEVKAQIETYDIPVPEKYESIPLSNYNPLDYIVACPYRIIGCEFSCKRSMLPDHLESCAYRVIDTVEDKLFKKSEEYEIVCPNTLMGCDAIFFRSQLQEHLKTCQYNPISREQEQHERLENKKIAIEAEEEERRRRVQAEQSQNEDSSHSWSSKLKFSDALKAIEATKCIHSRLNKVKSTAQVTWVVKAAEIEILRQSIARRAAETQEQMSNNSNSNNGQATYDMSIARTITSPIGESEQVIDIDRDIEDFSNICLKEIKNVSRMLPSIKEEIIQVCKSCFAGLDIDLQLYGSYATQLALPGVSDIDFVLSINSRRSISRINDKETMLQKKQFDIMNSFRCEILGRELEKLSNFKNVKAIYTASVPVIKFDFEGKIAVDITFDTPDHSGMKVVEFINQMKPFYPDLYPIVCMLKYILHKQGLMDPFTGGISSYAIVLLVFASLGRSYSLRKEKIGLSKLLLDVLKTIGSDFSPSANIISNYWLEASKGQIPCVIFIARRNLNLDGDDLAVIVDPFNEKNNISRSSFRFECAQSLFQVVYERLSAVNRGESLLSFPSMPFMKPVPEVLKNDLELFRYL